MFLLRSRGGACPARDLAATRTKRGNGKYGFPLWGKLSPQVTDEGAPAGHFPLIRRAGAPPSPQGEGFPPATLRHWQFYGSFVGAAYMPPATLRQREPNGGTARASNARPYNVVCGCATQRKREVYGSVVGAGHAPPATKRQREPNGETARASNARPYNAVCGCAAQRHW